MLKFNRNTEERKTIATRLGELTGLQPFYTRAPRYAYEIGPYTVDRDGDLFVDEEQADTDILTALMDEGLITGGEVVGEAEAAWDLPVPNLGPFGHGETDGGPSQLPETVPVDARDVDGPVIEHPADLRGEDDKDLVGPHSSPSITAAIFSRWLTTCVPFHVSETNLVLC